MSHSLSFVRHRLPFQLAGSPLGIKLFALFLGTGLLAASSWIAVPMIPVPMTMQTFAVALIAALCGWRLSVAIVMTWLAEAAIGLPVLAGGAGGIGPFLGPTGGYLLAFPVMALLVGLAAERGWVGRGVLLSFAVMVAAQGACLVLGAAWLAAMIGLPQAIALGVTPFILGSVLKAALALAALRATQGLMQPRRM